MIYLLDFFKTGEWCEADDISFKSTFHKDTTTRWMQSYVLTIKAGEKREWYWYHIATGWQSWSEISKPSSHQQTSRGWENVVSCDTKASIKQYQSHSWLSTIYEFFQHLLLDKLLPCVAFRESYTRWVGLKLSCVRTFGRFVPIKWAVSYLNAVTHRRLEGG